MNIKIKKLIFNLTYVYIIFSFIIYTNDFISTLLDYVYLTVILFLLIICNFKKNRKISIFIFIIFLIFILLLLLQINNNEFGFIDLMKVILFASISYLLFKDKDFFVDSYLGSKNVIYFITCAYLIAFLIISYLKGILNLNSFDFYLPLLGDKNWSGFIILLFMFFCYKRKYKIGLVISLIYTLLLNSRMTQIIFILFVILELLRKHKKFHRFYTKLCKINAFEIFITIIISQILLIGISYYCVYSIPINTISEYRESIIDSSNAMRVRANVYAMNEIIQNPRFIISGYDNQIKEQLGITDIGNSTIYMGFRLVQPHSLLLNLILRYGVIFSIIYLIFIAFMIKKYVNSDNNSFIIVYLLMNTMLAFLFSYKYLIFFLFLLSISKKNKKIIKEGAKAYEDISCNTSKGWVKGNTK